jgi:hypothetical protein
MTVPVPTSTGMCLCCNLNFIGEPSPDETKDVEHCYL